MAICRILYAEDNKFFYQLLMGELKPVEGVEIVWVSTIKDLMIALRKMSNPDQSRFDCLILDLNFTGESQGVSTFEKIVQDYSIPTLILTSDSSVDTYNRCIELGAKGVYTKENVEPVLIANKIVEIVSNYKPSFSEKIRIGLLRAQVATKSAQTFAIGYTTAAVNILVVAAIAYDFFFQYKTTGQFKPADWEITLLGVIGGAGGLGKILASMKKDAPK